MVDPKTWGDSAAGVWGRVMFHMSTADGKNLFLY